MDFVDVFLSSNKTLGMELRQHFHGEDGLFGSVSRQDSVTYPHFGDVAFGLKLLLTAIGIDLSNVFNGVGNRELVVSDFAVQKSCPVAYEILLCGEQSAITKRTGGERRWYH